MLYGLVILEFYNSLFHRALGIDKRYPYIPLMLTSCYTAFVIFYCWLKFLYVIAFKKIDYH